MPLFIWSDRFSVNVPEMDEQHKKWVGFINKLSDSKEDNEEQAVIGKALDELVDYTKTHLNREEELMRQYEYPDYKAHKSEHDNLVQQVLAMRKKYYEGDMNIAVDLAILLNDWLAEHILVIDKKYAPYLK